MNSIKQRPYTRSNHGTIKINNKNVAMYFGLAATTITAYKTTQPIKLAKMFQTFEEAVLSERIK